jgi:Icc protein
MSTAHTDKRFVIAQLSDIHCGDPRFDVHLLERVIDDVNELGPDIVVIPGDLTVSGYRDEYEQAQMHLSRIECPNMVVIPGNHDSRNVGYTHFLDLFGTRWQSHEMIFGIDVGGVSQEHIRIVSVDSSKPDLDDGEVGRHRYDWLSEKLGPPDEEVFKVVAIHHHLVGIPSTGRERNIVLDAGDVLEILAEHDVDLVLAGHKHVPFVWPISGMLVITSGTASTWRTRANIPPSYNVITVRHDKATVDIIDSTGEGRRSHTYAMHPHPRRRGAGRLSVQHEV